MKNQSSVRYRTFQLRAVRQRQDRALDLVDPVVCRDEPRTELRKACVLLRKEGPELEHALHVYLHPSQDDEWLGSRRVAGPLTRGFLEVSVYPAERLVQIIFRVPLRELSGSLRIFHRFGGRRFRRFSSM